MNQKILKRTSVAQTSNWAIFPQQKIFPIRRFSISEYHKIGENGILKDEHVELIEGVIIEMSPKGTKHSAIVSKLSTPFYELVLQDKVLLRVQDPVVLSNDTEPEPDLALVKPPVDAYMEQHPHSDDVWLLIEVSDTTLERDREIKLPIYAVSCIPEVWIVNLVEDIIEVYREPILLADGTGIYKIQMSFVEGDEVSPQAFPDTKIAIGEILMH